jgi:5-phospho-D-xylono-1,4-lactonase
MNSIIRTVTGDIDPQDAGPTYMHEHLIIDSAIVARDFPHIHLHEVDSATAEALDMRSHGVGTIVDCMPYESGGSPEKLKQISISSGIKIVYATGMHNKKYYENDLYAKLTGSNTLLRKMIHEINDGIGDEKIQCGIIKVATSSDVMRGEEKVIFESAAQAHRITGAPILTHCEAGTGALRQIEFFQDAKIPLASVVLSHTDKVFDSGYHREILSSGINVEYDQSLRQLDSPEKSSAELTISMIEAGFIKQIMLGTDGARRSLWKSHGGAPGLSALYGGWTNLLKGMGVSEANLHQIFTENPKRFLSFVPIQR